MSRHDRYPPRALSAHRDLDPWEHESITGEVFVDENVRRLYVEREHLERHAVVVRDRAQRELNRGDFTGLYETIRAADEDDGIRLELEPDGASGRIVITRP